jgi:hypothetical protein
MVHIPGFVGYGHYHEHYRKQKGAWLISHIRLTRLLVESGSPVALLPIGGDENAAG